MEEYIRKAFKALEDFAVTIEPIKKGLKEDVEEEESEEGLTLGQLFENEGSYILTKEFEDSGVDYYLFLEALNDGESCDILFDEFDVNNITEVLVEVLDSEHDFLGSLTGEGLTLESTFGEAISKAIAFINGEETAEEEPEFEPESEEEANEREFIGGDPEVEPVPESLQEAKFNVSDENEMKEAEEVVEKTDEETIEQIVDASAESIEDLKKSYLGSIILQCPTCGTKLYKNPEDLAGVEVEDDVYQLDEECPHCGAKDGFELIGQVASLEVDPFAQEKAPMDGSEPAPVETEEEEEVKFEAEPLPELETEEEEPAVEEPVELDLNKEKNEGLNEDINIKVNDEEIVINDGTEDVAVIPTPEPGEECENCEEKPEEASEEEIEAEAPVDVELDLDAEEVEEGCKGKECEIKLEDFDEVNFDKLVNRYLKENYHNVDSYSTVDAGIDNSTNRISVEGIIKFKSGKEKTTKFIFEAKEVTHKKQLKLVGINETFTKGKAFTLVGTFNNNKLLSESLSYHYSINDKKVKGKVDFRK